MEKIVFTLMTCMLLISYQVKSQNLTHNKNSEKMEKLAKQEIESLLMTYKGTLNTSDAEKAASLYTKDGIFMPSSAPSAIGTENVKAAYDFVFSRNNGSLTLSKNVLWKKSFNNANRYQSFFFGGGIPQTNIKQNRVRWVQI